MSHICQRTMFPCCDCFQLQGGVGFVFKWEVAILPNPDFIFILEFLIRLRMITEMSSHVFKSRRN